MKKVWRIITNPIIYLVLILALAFVVRMYKIDNPIADWHSWRQADTAAVARNFYKLGYTPFVPIYDDMSGVSDPPAINPNRYRFVEFPIYESAVYFMYLINGGVDERLARLVSIFFSLGSITLIYFLVKEYFGKATALLSSLLFASLPYSIYYSRVILPEPSLVFFSLGMLYFAHKWIGNNSRKDFIISIIFAMCAYLTKPTAIFYLTPLLYDYYQKEKRLWPIPIRYFIWLIIGLIPFGFWRIWMQQHPEGIPASNWLLNGNGIRFKPIFWRWILRDRLSREMLSVAGIMVFFLGLIIKPFKKEGWFLHLLLAGMFIYLNVFATGNVQHDYYQYLIMPAVAIFAARGFVLLFKGLPYLLPRLLSIPIAILLIVMMYYLTWMEIKGLYQINNPVIVEAGQEADKILPKDAKVIAPYQGDTAFLYQTNRSGFPFIPLPIEELRDKYGISYLVSVAKDNETQDAMKKYTILMDTGDYVIVDLTKPKTPL
jgi:hypothetical protein